MDFPVPGLFAGVVADYGKMVNHGGRLLVTMTRKTTAMAGAFHHVAVLFPCYEVGFPSSVT